MLTERQLAEERARFPIQEVWGIGKQYVTWLHAEGITTAEAFITLPRSLVRKPRKMLICT